MEYYDRQASPQFLHPHSKQGWNSLRLATYNIPLQSYSQQEPRMINTPQASPLTLFLDDDKLWIILY
jgi:hypothetical protein